MVRDVGVLSIGKLVAGQERYYQRQIAKGLDDYYAGRGEAPGRWIGAGAASLGLGGRVEEGQLGALIAGLDPRSGGELRVQETRVAALDLTFSAPKSVSVLFAVAAAPVSRTVVECHEEAVGAALAYLEETAAFVRRGPNAARRFEHDGGLVAAAYRHRMSRALDPQLHTHCVTANMARGPDGRWTALHHPSLYRAAQTAGYLYQAHLRVGVHERLGLEWGPVRKGAAELAGIDRGLLEEFSRRRHEMRRAAEEDGGLGLDTKKRSEKAAIATRERKQYGVDTHTWREEVQARRRSTASTAAGSPVCCRPVRGASSASRLDRESPRRLREVDDALVGADGLTEKDNTFDERAVLRAYAQAAGQGATVARLRARAAQFANRGDVLATQRGEMTTAELVGVERALIAAAQGRAGEGTGRVDKRTFVEALAACEREITGEQRAAVHATVSSRARGAGDRGAGGHRQDLHRGRARLRLSPGGLRGARCRADGARRARAHRRGADPVPDARLHGAQGPQRRRASRGLSWWCSMRRAWPAHARPAVLLEAAARAAAKVVVIGDPGQLHSVQAGGWMRAVGRRVGVLKLSEVMRQRDHGERRALGLTPRGRSDRLARVGARTRTGRARRRTTRRRRGRWRSGRPPLASTGCGKRC